MPHVKLRTLSFLSRQVEQDLDRPGTPTIYLVGTSPFKPSCQYSAIVRRGAAAASLLEIGPEPEWG